MNKKLRICQKCIFNLINIYQLKIGIVDSESSDPWAVPNLHKLRKSSAPDLNSGWFKIRTKNT